MFSKFRQSDPTEAYVSESLVTIGSDDHRYWYVCLQHVDKRYMPFFIHLDSAVSVGPW